MTGGGSLQIAVLEDRGVVSVSGPDAEKLLSGLVTNDMARLSERPAMFAALLAPQGKILFDFLVVKAGDGFLLDTPRARAADLAKRLSMYKLRADVAIRDASTDYDVAALWGGAVAADAVADCIVFEDPRLAALGDRLIAKVGRVAALAGELGATVVSSADYRAHCIEKGVPEGGRDFAYGDTFPHEALMDQLGGVSFTKGCFVGQEVVSRMQHRTTVRKRVVVIEGDAPLPADPVPVKMGDVEIGRLGSVDGTRGLALLRIDRVAEARRDGVDVTAGGVPVRVSAPAYATFRIEGAP